MECSAVTRADESQNKCDIDNSHYPMNLFLIIHTTITLCPSYKPSSLLCQKNDLINPNWSIIGKFYQEIEILSLKCGKWKLGGKKLWKVEIRG